VRNSNRLRRLESKLSPIGLTVIGITSVLDDRVPEDSYGKIVSGGELIVQTNSEYMAEVLDTTNLISIGGVS